jgi:hypothetical protein
MERSDLWFFVVLAALVVVAFVGCGKEKIRYCVEKDTPSQTCCSTFVQGRLEGCDGPAKVIYNPQNVVEIHD